VNAAQFSHFCIEDFQKEKETSKKNKGIKAHLRILWQLCTLVHTAHFESQAMPWMKVFG
jgi:hypothetical protein